MLFWTSMLIEQMSYPPPAIHPPALMFPFTKVITEVALVLDQKELIGLPRVLLAYFPGRHPLISFGNTFTQRLVQ